MDSNGMGVNYYDIFVDLDKKAATHKHKHQLLSTEKTQKRYSLAAQEYQRSLSELSIWAASNGIALASLPNFNILNYPHIYFYRASLGVYSVYYPFEITTNNFHHFLSVASIPHPTLNAPVYFEHSSPESPAPHAMVIGLAQSLINLIKCLPSANLPITYPQALEAFKKTCQIAICALDTPDMCFSVIDENLCFYNEQRELCILSTSSFSTFRNNCLRMESKELLPLPNPQLVKLLFTTLRNDMVKGKPSAAKSAKNPFYLYYNATEFDGVKTDFSGHSRIKLEYQFASKAFRVTNETPSSTDKVVALPASFSAAATEPPTQLIYALTGGNNLILEELAKLAANIYLSNPVNKHITLIHTPNDEALRAFFYFLCVGQGLCNHVSCYSLKSVTTLRTISKLIDQKLNNTFCNISFGMDSKLPSNLCLKTMEKLACGKRISMNDSLVGKKIYKNAMHMVHITRFDEDVKALANQKYVKLITVDRPALATAWLSHSEMMWLRVILPLYGIYLMNNRKQSNPKPSTEPSIGVDEFIKKYCILDPQKHIVCSELHQKYQLYAYENYLGPMKRLHFSKCLEALGIKSVRSHHTTAHNKLYYEGICLDDEAFEARIKHPLLKDALCSMEEQHQHLLEITQLIQFES